MYELKKSICTTSLLEFCPSECLKNKLRLVLRYVAWALQKRGFNVHKVSLFSKEDGYVTGIFIWREKYLKIQRIVLTSNNRGSFGHSSSLYKSNPLWTRLYVKMMQRFHLSLELLSEFLSFSKGRIDLQTVIHVLCAWVGLCTKLKLLCQQCMSSKCDFTLFWF